MPTELRDATIQPFPMGFKDSTLSANYHGIALASSPSNILEWSTLTTWSDYSTTSELQFGFQSGFSTILCTGIMKTVINRYLNKGFKVYACLIDASKAFKTVEHCLLFQKLLERRMPKPICWYMAQIGWFQWSGRSSAFRAYQWGMPRWCS